MATTVSTVQKRVQAGELFLVDTLHTQHGNEAEVRANAQAITRNFVRYGMRGDTVRAPLIEIDSAVLSDAAIDSVEIPEDVADLSGLFVTAEALVSATEHGPDPVLAQSFPHYVLEPAA